MGSADERAGRKWFPYDRRYQAGKMLFDAVFPIVIDLMIGGIIVKWLMARH